MPNDNEKTQILIKEIDNKQSDLNAHTLAPIYDEKSHTFLPLWSI